MASLKLSFSLHSFDSNKFDFPVNSPPLSDYCSLFSINGYIHLNKSCILYSLARVHKPSKVSQVEPEASDVSQSRFDDIDSRKKYFTAKKPSKRAAGSHFSFSRNCSEKIFENILFSGGELDVNYSTISSDLSLEGCNAILKRLEKCNDSKTLDFFEWMRSNGKLKHNVSAYNLVLRVLGRQEDWDAAEKLIKEVRAELGSQLDFQVFNTLIYACYKSGFVEWGTKWFRMMLECQVQPNVATFGMLMGLYQKSCDIEESEFAFNQMRNFGIVCETAYASMITIYIRMNLYDKAEEVIQLMQKDKVIPNLENWLVMLNAYCQQGKMEEAELVFASMEEAGFSSNIIAYNTLITGYGKASNMDTAQRLFLGIKNSGVEPDETTYRSMIEGWGRAGNYKMAEWYYKELKRKGYMPNSSNLFTLINLQAKHEDEAGALKTLNDMLKIGCRPSSIVGNVLQAYEKARRIKSVPVLLTGSFYRKVLSSQTSCSILVMAYVKHCLVDDALKVLREKEWKDHHFEENLYHLLICSCKELGHFESAIKIYAQRPKRENKPNLHITCTMIDIYSIMGRFSDGEKLYLSLRSSGIPLDLIAYNVVVRMYVKAGSLEDACSVLDLMAEQQDIVPDVYLLRDMLRIYQRCGMVHKLSDLYYRILKSGVSWDQEMYNCVINCCSRALPVDELSRLFDEMLQCGFAPNTVTLNVMLDVYGKSKLFAKARNLFGFAQKRGLVDAISYNTMISVYGKNKDFKNMSSTVQQMKFNGFSVSLEAYNCMLDAYGKECQMENFRSVLQRMQESTSECDHYTYNIMINIYGERGWIDEVAEVLTELKACGLEPDLYSYNTLIKAYGIAGMVEEAARLVKEMREKGIEPDRITYINMIRALQRNDQFLEAIKWSLWMKQMKY
ncbi:hypothetical protein IC582_003768 [Cucumis melo]|uniref:Pentatricopeptide repeat-containing protein At4g30825, chloroplastic n=2 Tax=Cucumis melo TaxID=3656 RepID=A0A1S4DV41_CUCME|nr:pentatricopeptide repeat-containing protein At4g30825, chloroplastic [Cucumis melo]KAA0035106.1 pentatricopeptide repeat-containing protein [Cucumis melo var. makuwa]TYJ95972.1 pentatricopeptide repeat-containing protein [Cucumis melo var. makuwa]